MRLKFKEDKKRSVILVTKDVNLRMKAKAIGLPAEGSSSTDRISNVEGFTGKEIIENFNDDILVKLYQPPFEVPLSEVKNFLKGEISRE